MEETQKHTSCGTKTNDTLDTPVAALCTHPTIVVTPWTSVGNAFKKARQKQAHFILVETGGVVSGMVKVGTLKFATKIDAIGQWVSPLRWRMAPDTTCSSALRMLKAHDWDWLLVGDRHKAVGIVTRDALETWQAGA